MKTISLTRGKCAIVDDDIYESLNEHKWHCNRGYAKRRAVVGGRSKILLMHRVILNTPHGLFTDHINGNKLDNRRENLRVSTFAENLWNRDATKRNTSGFKGVSWESGRQVWRARINYLGKIVSLGRYATKEQAAMAYNRAAIMFHGDFAKLNAVVLTAIHEEEREITLADSVVRRIQCKS